MKRVLARTIFFEIWTVDYYKGKLYRNCDEPYKKLFEIFNDTLNHHAPLKQKQVSGNHAPFMTKDLNKAIMSNSKAKNKYLN